MQCSLDTERNNVHCPKKSNLNKQKLLLILKWPKNMHAPISNLNKFLTQFLIVQVIHSLSVNMTNSHTVESGLWHWRAQPGLQASQGTEASLCFSRWGRNNEQQTQKCLNLTEETTDLGNHVPHEFCHFWAGFVGVIGSEHGQLHL